MTKNHRKILFTGICAIIVITVTIIIAVIAMQAPGLTDSFFVSDGTKYVINLASDEINLDTNSIKPAKGYIVCFYKSDTITDAKEYYEFSSTTDAQAVYDYLSKNTPTSYKAVGVDGKYLILTAKDAEYADKTPDEIKEYIESANDLAPTSASSTNQTINVFDETGESIDANIDPEEAGGYDTDIKLTD